MERGIELDGKIYKSVLHHQIYDLLSSVDEDTLFSIASTACNKKILPVDRAEAIDTIMLFTQTTERLFSYKRITSQMLTSYLYTNKISIPANPSKITLISKVMELWKNKIDQKTIVPIKKQESTDLTSPKTIHKDVESTEVEQHSVVDSTTNEYINTNHNVTTPCSIISQNKILSDEFSKKFVTWFYTSINSIAEKNDLTYTTLMFCENAITDVYFISKESNDHLHAEGAESSAREFHKVVLEHKLVFNPNMDSGIKANKSPHGLVQVYCCGSIHKANSFVGIFEQEFGLCQSPLDRRWKVVFTKLNLKGAVYQVPSLCPGEIFEIEDVS